MYAIYLCYTCRANTNCIKMFGTDHFLKLPLPNAALDSVDISKLCIATYNMNRYWATYLSIFVNVQLMLYVE